MLCGNDELAYKVSFWRNIEHIYATSGVVVGLQTDGKVLVASKEPIFDTSHWRDIIDISCISDRIAGIKGNGEVYFTGNVSNTLKYSGLKNILTVNLSRNFISAITFSGTVWMGDDGDLEEVSDTVSPIFMDAGMFCKIMIGNSGRVLLFQEDIIDLDWHLFNGSYEFPMKKTPVTTPTESASVQNTSAPASSSSEKNNYLILAIVFLFLFWPASIYFFYKYSKS